MLSTKKRGIRVCLKISTTCMTRVNDFFQKYKNLFFFPLEFLIEINWEIINPTMVLDVEKFSHNLNCRPSLNNNNFPCNPHGYFGALTFSGGQICRGWVKATEKVTLGFFEGLFGQSKLACFKVNWKFLSSCLLSCLYQQFVVYLAVNSIEIFSV